MERIARQCDAGLAVDSTLRETMERQVTLDAKDAPWKDAIALLESEYSITLALENDRLMVGDADAEFAKKLVRQTYDVRLLTKPVQSFPGPELDIPEPGGQGAKLLPPIEPESVADALEIGDAIRKYVRPQSWTRGGVDLRESSRGELVITQTPEVQDEIRAFLAKLERTAAREVVCRAYRIAPPDGAGPVLDADAWGKLAKDAGAPVAAFVMVDGQQNHHFSGVQASYVADADVVQGVDDPIVTVISRGLNVDVEPQATIGGVIATIRFDASIDMDLTPTPIADPAGKALATIALPKTRIDTSRGSRLVPKGGAALLRFGERGYALTFEVADWPEQPPAKK